MAKTKKESTRVDVDTEIDLLIHPIGELATPALDQSGPARKEALSGIARIEDGAIAIVDGRISLAGPADAVLPQIEGRNVTRSMSARDRLVTPGFVDPHTHLVFGGNRANEFMMRCAGASYSEIAEAGGGIVASTEGTRSASLDDLVDTGGRRLERMLAHGTTTCEVKTGYGLTRESELKMLEAILELSEAQQVEIVPTFLPAHAVPPGVERETYVKEIVDEILPEALSLIRKKNLAPEALYVDVFCDRGYFTLADTRAIFEKAAELGMSLKVHADEFESLGATSLAVEMNASSADHLLTISDEDMKLLAASDTVAVLLPGTSFFLNLEEHAPARKMIESGVAVAVGSDYNPGSCHIFSEPMIMGLACLHLGLSAEEALTAMTINSAFAVGLGDRVGQLTAGYQADIIMWDVPRLEEIPYNMGWNPVHTVIKNGAVVHSLQSGN